MPTYIRLAVSSVTFNAIALNYVLFVFLFWYFNVAFFKTYLGIRFLLELKHEHLEKQFFKLVF